MNLLLGQPDATTHNFYLYNPTGTERFYIHPWDYDYALSADEEPPGGFSSDALGERLHYGFGKVVSSNFLKRLYRQPGFHAKLLAKVGELRGGPLSDATIDDLATRYTAVVTPFARRGPEQYIHKPEQAARFSEYVRTNEAGIRSGFLPMPFNLAEPRVRDGQVEFRWEPAHDVTGRRTIRYDLEVASSPDFASGSRLPFESGIADGVERVRFLGPRGADRVGSALLPRRRPRRRGPGPLVAGRRRPRERQRGPVRRHPGVRRSVSEPCGPERRIGARKQRVRAETDEGTARDGRHPIGHPLRRRDLTARVSVVDSVSIR